MPRSSPCTSYSSLVLALLLADATAFTQHAAPLASTAPTRAATFLQSSTLPSSTTAFNDTSIQFHELSKEFHQDIANGDIVSSAATGSSGSSEEQANDKSKPAGTRPTVAQLNSLFDIDGAQKQKPETHETTYVKKSVPPKGAVMNNKNSNNKIKEAAVVKAEAIMDAIVDGHTPQEKKEEKEEQQEKQQKEEMTLTRTEHLQSILNAAVQLHGRCTPEDAVHSESIQALIDNVTYALSLPCKQQQESKDDECDLLPDAPLKPRTKQQVAQELERATSFYMQVSTPQNQRNMEALAAEYHSLVQQAHVQAVMGTGTTTATEETVKQEDVVPVAVFQERLAELEAQLVVEEEPVAIVEEEEEPAVEEPILSKMRWWKQAKPLDEVSSTTAAVVEEVEPVETPVATDTDSNSISPVTSTPKTYPVPLFENGVAPDWQVMRDLLDCATALYGHAFAASVTAPEHELQLHQNVQDVQELIEEIGHYLFYSTTDSSEAVEVLMRTKATIAQELDAALQQHMMNTDSAEDTESLLRELAAEYSEADSYSAFDTANNNMVDPFDTDEPTVLVSAESVVSSLVDRLAELQEQVGVETAPAVEPKAQLTDHATDPLKAKIDYDVDAIGYTKQLNGDSPEAAKAAFDAVVAQAQANAEMAKTETPKEEEPVDPFAAPPRDAYGKVQQGETQAAQSTPVVEVKESDKIKAQAMDVELESDADDASLFENLPSALEAEDVVIVDDEVSAVMESPKADIEEQQDIEEEQEEKEIAIPEEEAKKEPAKNVSAESMAGNLIGRTIKGAFGLGRAKPMPAEIAAEIAEEPKMDAKEYAITEEKIRALKALLEQENNEDINVKFSALFQRDSVGLEQRIGLRRAFVKQLWSVTIENLRDFAECLKQAEADAEMEAMEAMLGLDEEPDEQQQPNGMGIPK